MLFSRRSQRPKVSRSVNFSGRATDSGAGRDYLPNPPDDHTRLLLTALNLRVYSDNHPAGADVRWTLYQQNPTLEGCTNALVHALWKDDMVHLEARLERARVYSIRSEAGHIRLVAYGIDQATPLEVMLQVGGEQVLLEQVQQNGLMDDFIAIAGSLRAAPPQPGFSSPRLNGEP